MLAYRDEYIIVRCFGRLKGNERSLTPMYLLRYDHATGLIRMNTIGLRILTLLEFVVRVKLYKANADIAGLYAGNPSLKTRQPTAETLLGAFSYIDLIGIEGANGISYNDTQLTTLQQDILELLDFPPEIYTQLVSFFLNS